MSRLSMLIHDSLTALTNPLCSVPPVSSLPCDLVVGGWWWGIAILKLLSKPCDFSKTVLKWPSVSWVSNCDPHDVTQCTREGYLQVGKTCWENDFASDFIQGASLIFKRRSAKMQLLPTTKQKKKRKLAPALIFNEFHCSRWITSPYMAFKTTQYHWVELHFPNV